MNLNSSQKDIILGLKKIVHKKSHIILIALFTPDVDYD